MVREILTESGFVEGETFAETQFVSPPRNTSYAVFNDSFTRRGGDGINLIKDHTYTIELYSEWPDPEAETRIESVFDARGVEFDKDERFWIQAEQLYQTIYTFRHIEK